MRTAIVHSDNYFDALRAKNDLKEEFPDKIFQIRKKKHNRNRITFTVVERIANPSHNKEEKSNPSKRRKKNRGASF